jgi:hypothetical protein
MYPRRFPAVRPIHPRSDQSRVLLEGEQAATKHRMSAGLRNCAQITNREMTSSVHFSAIAALSRSAARMLAMAHPSLQRRLKPLVAAKTTARPRKRSTDLRSLKVQL